MAESKVVVVRGETIVTPPGRASFTKLVTPETYNGKTLYKLDLLLPKKETDFTELTEAIQNLIDIKWSGEGFNCDDMDFHPFRDGDDMKKQYDGYANAVFLRLASDVVVPCFGPDKAPINANRIYDGALIRCGVVPGVWQGPTSDRGAKLYLSFIQFLEDRPRFGRVTANADEILDEWKVKKGAATAAAMSATPTPTPAPSPKVAPAKAKAMGKMSMASFSKPVATNGEEEESAPTEETDQEGDAVEHATSTVPVSKKAAGRPPGAKAKAAVSNGKSMLSDL